MVDDVIRAFTVSQGFCLLVATNQEEGAGDIHLCEHSDMCLNLIDLIVVLYPYQIFKIILHCFVLTCCSVKLVAGLELSLCYRWTN